MSICSVLITEQWYGNWTPKFRLVEVYNGQINEVECNCLEHWDANNRGCDASMQNELPILLFQNQFLIKCFGRLEVIAYFDIPRYLRMNVTPTNSIWKMDFLVKQKYLASLSFGELVFCVIVSEKKRNIFRRIHFCFL